jgi:preprotein translocase subunit SecE
MAETTLTQQTTDIERKSFKDKITGFFIDVNKEMKKVTWPTREALQDATLVTLALCIISSVFIFGVDKIFEIVLRLLYGV